MYIYILTFIVIIILIYTNALTDAPNAISTVVGTKVLNFKKAAYMSAFFNLLGIIFMSLFNLSVANCITSMINLDNQLEGTTVIFSGIISTIIFSNIALQFGIPTSETHSLIAGLTGSLIAYKGIESINFSEWKKVLIGLVFSILGGYFVTKILKKILSKKINNIKEYKQKRLQIFSSMGVSFMHGAQDGQKFIGVLIIFYSLVNNVHVPTNANPIDYIWIIILTSIVMFIGVAIGGKKIVDTLGSELMSLDNKDAIISDFSTILILLVSSLNGFPISTSHVKTMSIISTADDSKQVNKKKTIDIFKAWIYTFPICGIISFLVMKFIEINIF